VTQALQLGWEEWVSLPDLGLPAIKAKIDTGARTSALHASTIEPYEDDGKAMVRFAVHPVPGRDDVAVWCAAPVLGQREVTSSNGEREVRPLVSCRLAIAGREWPIEVTLTNREGMAYRMLIGRRAIQGRATVDPTRSFLQPRLSHRVYRGLPGAGAATRRSLRIAILTRRPDNASNVLLAEAAQARGHRLDIIDRGQLSLLVDPKASALLLDGAPLPHVDAVIPRTGAKITALSVAVVRHLEHTGAVSANAAAALAVLRDPIAVLQALAGAGLPCPTTAISPRGTVGGEESLEAVLAGDLPRGGPERVVRVLIVDGHAVAAAASTRQRSIKGGVAAEAGSWEALSLAAEGREGIVATGVARALGLGVASVDMVETRAGPFIVGVSATPALAHLERLTGEDLGAAIIAALERRTRSPLGFAPARGTV
jgi:ribosomal protein S6--L-glutamate ligase